MLILFTRNDSVPQLHIKCIEETSNIFTGKFMNIFYYFFRRVNKIWQIQIHKENDLTL